MSETTDNRDKKPLRLSSSGRLELKKTVDAGQVRQSFSHGRSKAVAVEVKKRRSFTPDADAARRAAAEGTKPRGRGGEAVRGRRLTEEEKAVRVRALRDAIHHEEEREAKREEVEASRRAREDAQRAHDEALARQQAELEARRAEEVRKREAEDESRKQDEERRKADEESRRTQEETRRKRDEELRTRVAERTAARMTERGVTAPEEEEAPARRGKGVPKRPATPSPRKSEQRRRSHKLTIAAVLSGDTEVERTRSVAAMRRARERERQRAHGLDDGSGKIVRDVIVPETITVQELASRMAEKGADVIKRLMGMGVMATINQSIDADTAEVIVSEFGHRIRRVAESDVEIGLEGEEDADELLQPRPPVVTVMGHVDHGKTSLLDALRKTNVVAGEAGGITQHIGAYQITMPSGDRITFIDTPGHEAFTAMRARGAKATDLVILVVAADDGVQPQTVEAINHARAARVPIIVAINKCDLPAADPDRIRNQLLQHEIVTEAMGGDVLTVEVSAAKGTNLDKLEEAILLQAEILELRANPRRLAQGVVVESKLERGRGPVATVLVQRGTLKVGDIFIAGAEWGRVRAMLDDLGNPITEAGPATPVEVQGLQGTPDAGDDFSVVGNEQRARDIADFRQRKVRQTRTASAAPIAAEDLFKQFGAGEKRVLPVVVKGDVQGSVEAIVGALQKLETDEVGVRVLHQGVGGINESDVTLAKASSGLIIGFNVRANPQAREITRRDGIDVRYYNIIYQVVDDARAMLSGMLSPAMRENFLGNAQIRQVFAITKVGKVAGCMVTEGVVRRGAGVRLLRDNVVIHEGKLSTLKRFKDEVREVREGFECGMAFENYQDLKEGDVIECYEVEEVARELAAG